MTIEWHKQSFGPPDAPPVIFLHGFLGTGMDWNPIAGELAECCLCVCPDLPGHGQTKMDDQIPVHNLRTVAADLLRHLEKAGLSRCALAGYSMGARLALCMALEAPGRFTGLVLESGSPGIQGEPERQARLQSDQALARRLDAMEGDRAAFQIFLREWYSGPLFAPMGAQPVRLEELFTERMTQRPRALAKGLRAMSVGLQPDLWPRLPELDLPVLLIAGKRDGKYRALAEAMHSRLPHAAVRVFPECGHNVHWEDPRGYTMAIRDFLATLR